MTPRTPVQPDLPGLRAALELLRDAPARALSIEYVREVARAALAGVGVHQEADPFAPPDAGRGLDMERLARALDKAIGDEYSLVPFDLRRQQAVRIRDEYQRLDPANRYAAEPPRGEPE